MGSVILSSMFVNWKPFWFLLFADKDVFEKFQFFDLNTSIWTLFLYPLALGIALALALPWVRLVGAILAQHPVDLLRKRQSDASHNQRLYRLEHDIKEGKARAQLEKTREEAQIEAAERLAKAQEIDKKLAENIIDERQANEDGPSDANLSLEERDLICIIAFEGNGFVGTFEISEGYRFVSGEIEFIIPHRRLLEINASLKKFRRLNYLRELENELTLSGYDLADDIALRSSDERNSIKKRFIEHFSKDPMG